MSNHDLPEPKAAQYSDAEKKDRHWSLISTIVWFIAGYSLIHKLLIPAILKFTEVTKSPYAKIDFLFIQPLWLAFLLHQRKRNTKLISLLCGFSIAYGALEVFQVSQGTYEGWLAVSRLLSAVPLAVAAAYIMTQPSSEKSFSLAWLGALGVSALLFMNHSTPQEEVAKITREESADEPLRSLNPINQECGNSQLTLNLNDSPPPTSEIIIDETCGLRPAVVVPGADKIKIINQTKRATNIHLMVFDGNKTSSGWNMMVTAESSLESPKLPTISAGFAFVFSDNSPSVGLSGLILNAQKKEEKYQITRSPLRVRKLP